MSAGEILLPKMDDWPVRVHKLVVRTTARCSSVQSQKTYWTGVKLAKPRLNAKPDDYATPFENHNHLGNWLAGQTRPDLSFGEPMHGFAELINSQT